MFSCCSGAPDGASTHIDTILPEKGEEQKVATLEPEMEEASPPAAAAASQAKTAKRFEGPGKVAVSLRRATCDQPWGITAELVCGASDMLLITKVASGSPGDAYNKSAAAGAFLLEAGDVITGINGKGEAPDMLKELREPKSTLDFDVNRPRAITVKIEKEGEPMGVAVKHLETGRALFVKDIKDGGLVKQRGVDIKSGDLIVGVNGIRGNAIELLDAMKGSEVLQVEVNRVEGRRALRK